MHRSVRAALLAPVLLCAVSGSAWAVGVFLNGVSIDGATNQQFRNVSVRIDARGDVYIDAPAYQVQRVESPGTASRPPAVSTPATAAPTGPATYRYWLVTDQATRGRTQFEIDVFINGQFLRTLRNDEEQVILDVTRQLHSGRNTVLLVARKVIQGGRLSASPSHHFRVVVGEGQESRGTVMIDRPLVIFTRTADEMQSEIRQEFNVDAR